MSISNEKVIRFAEEQGFNLVGFAAAEELRQEIARLKEWLEKGYNAGMGYMTRNLEKKQDPTQLLSSVRTVISLGMNYYHPVQYQESSCCGKVSRFAWGKDYHAVIDKKIVKIIEACRQLDDAFEAIAFCDAGPVMDKVWAVRAGLGWMGKHSNIISRRWGSWFFIANIFCNFDFNYREQVGNFCGTCTKCIDACPTKAIVADTVVDSSKCISFLTIENKQHIPDGFSGKFGNWIFGCDICQDVCPWNLRFSTKSSLSEFLPLEGQTCYPAGYFENMTNQDFKSRFGASPIARAKLSGMRRNADFLFKDSASS